MKRQNSGSQDHGLKRQRSGSQHEEDAAALRSRLASRERELVTVRHQLSTTQSALATANSSSPKFGTLQFQKFVNGGLIPITKYPTKETDFHTYFNALNFRDENKTAEVAEDVRNYLYQLFKKMHSGEITETSDAGRFLWQKLDEAHKDQTWTITLGYGMHTRYERDHSSDYQLFIECNPEFNLPRFRITRDVRKEPHPLTPRASAKKSPRNSQSRSPRGSQKK